MRDLRSAIRLHEEMKRSAYLAFFLICLPLTGFAQKLDASIGWDYEDSKQNTGTAVLNGWYGSLSYNVLPRLGLTVEHESYWGQSQGGQRTNDHAWLGGVTWNLLSSEHKIIPFIQPLVGTTRSSGSGEVDYDLTFQVAGGVNVKLKGPVSLQLTPVEYVATRIHGLNYNSYGAAAGFQFSFK